MTVKKFEKVKKSDKAASKKQLVCSICGKPTARLVDGEPSCDDHAALVYENQLEDYTREQLNEKDTAKASKS